MKAVYSVRTCCGDHVDYVEYEHPDAGIAADDSVACIGALLSTNYSYGERCNGCGDNRYHAVFVGWPIRTIAAKGKIVAGSRSALIVALEAALRAAIAGNDDTTYAVFNDESGFVG
jgi:hypothetical protein